MNIQEHTDSVVEQIDARIKDKTLPRPVYVAVGAGTLLLEKAETLGEQIVALPDRVRTEAARRREEVQERISSAPADTREGVENAVARTRGQLQDQVDVLATRGDRWLTQRLTRREWQQRMDRVSETVTPYASQADIAGRDAWRRLRDSKFGVSVSNAAQQVADATRPVDEVGRPVA